MKKKVEIIATIGPSTVKGNNLAQIIPQIGFARINFSWGDRQQKIDFFQMIRTESKKSHHEVKIIADLSGPRMQEKVGHHMDPQATQIITETDKDNLKFCLESNVDMIAMSYVGTAQDIMEMRNLMEACGRVVPIIAKVERAIALKNLVEIIKVSDAIMVARGDLGNEIPIEKIPLTEKEIVEKCTLLDKQVYVATQMMLSMTEHPYPTRAEVTDVYFAVKIGADAVMLSEESANGKFPVEAVTEMRKIIDETLGE